MLESRVLRQAKDGSEMLTEVQLLIQQTARDFASQELAPNAPQWDENATFPVQAVERMGALGFMGMMIPETYGGSGCDMISYVLALEAVASGCASCSTIMAVNNSVVCSPLLHFGNDWQKEHFLKPLSSGQMLGAFCLTEPDAGSDAANLKTKAVREGQSYRLNGVKQFITSGKNADIAIVIAASNPALGKKGISAFIVPTDTPGYQVASIEKKMGQRASDTAQIVLDNCVIPCEQLLGDEGEGYKIALSNLQSGRIGIAAQSLGIAQAAFDVAKKYASTRETFGKLLYQHQSVAFCLAEMATQIEVMRQMIYHAAKMHDNHLPHLKEVAIAKLFSSETAETICSKAIHILGGYGYLEDYDVARHYRDVKVAQIYEGTNEVQKMLIAKALFEE